MRRKPAAFFVWMCALAFFAIYPSTVVAANASSLPATLPSECPKGSPTGNPTGSKTFTMSQVSDLRMYLRQVVYCANACYDENLTVAVSISLTGKTVNVTTSIPKNGNICGTLDPTADDLKKANRGCASGEIQPKVTIHVPAIPVAGIPDKIIGPKSRCDARLAQITDSAFAAASASDIKGFNGALAQMDQLPATAPPAQDAGTQALANALSGFGVPQDQAQAIAKSAVSTSDLLKALQSGDSNTINTALQKAADAAGVTLNPNVTDNISKLTPDQVAAKISDLAGIDVTRPPVDTFNPTNDRQIEIPGGVQGPMLQNTEKQYGIDTFAPNYLAGLQKFESGGNPNAISPTGAAGPYQYTSGTWKIWSSKWNAAINGDATPLPDSLRFDPQVSSQVTAYYTQQNWQQYGSLIQSSGMNTDAALYAIHNLGDGGGPNFIRAYAQDPNQLVSSVIQADQIRYNPAVYGNGNITLAQAQQNMLNGMSGSTNFTARPTYPFSVGNSGTVQNVGQYLGSLISGNPFVSANPGYSLGQFGSFGGNGGGSYSGGGVSQVQVQPPVYETPQAQLVQPAGTILATPSSAAVGTRIQVTWSSVGMRTDIPCSIFVNGAYRIGQGNDGTAFATSTTAKVGDSWIFSMRCTAAGGSSFEKEATVTFR